MTLNFQDPKMVLQKYFGYSDFRPGQKKLIDSMTSGRDVLAIMPTGGGKSLCYQIPALMLKGVTLVISPLISLMHDQVTALTSAGIPAAYLNSSLTLNQYRLALSRAAAGKYKIIYVAPERLMTPAFQDLCRKIPIAMVAVDEAHCISSWGQNFRPAYLEIPEFLKTLPHRPVVGAFTATATARVREDILNLLKLNQPLVEISGFDRPNLYFDCVRVAEKDRDEVLWNFVKKHSAESGIVYCITRAQTEEVAEFLESRGISAAAYHGGMSDADRRKTQEDFIYDRIHVIAATNAFGMGIDKSNVRYVVHYAMPQSLENYYQEAGRAGRDGLPSQCLLINTPKDYQTNRFLIEQNQNSAVSGLSATQQEMSQAMDFVRLNAMRGYCYTEGCLRTYILQYFGEPVSGQCENCSHCERGYREQDVTNMAKVFAEAFRALPAAYGISILKDFFHGSRNRKITDKKLDQVPGFGALEFLSAYDIQDYLELFCSDGFLQRSPDAYQTITATDRLRQLLKDGKPVKIHRLMSARQAVQAKKDLSDLSESEKTLFERLKKTRMRLAIRNKIPPYIVFNDRTLRQMACRQPENREEMLQISGIGEQKYERYGQAFLETLSSWKEEENDGTEQ